ncbi:MaoC/PaaZ C-terminal domain-containing protein [Streptomyces sp. KLOTTS4A1]|uniref:MaoC/PaaZ C-terminal domain-containing protein n=1 Tax=Streptomyces sp. KLOTTS4A1 TaxID=3390996 RepID=UPI0039F4D9A2
MTTRSLPAAPRLGPLLARGALLSPLKRVRQDATAPPTRLLLDAASADPKKLAAYRRICRFPLTGPLPVTYPHLLGFPLAMRLMAEPAFPLPLLGLVHTSIEITQHRPLSPGLPLEISVFTQGLSAHRRGTEANVVTQARLGGEPVWESHSTYLAKHRTPADDRRGPDPALAVVPDLPVSDRWTLPADLGRRYGAVSGDRNPIHLHPLTAKAFGFHRAIAHGMWTFGRCLAEHGAEGEVRVGARFKAPVLLPGTVSYAADATRFQLRGEDGRLHLSGAVTRNGQA